MGVVSLSFHAGFMDAPMLIANTWFIRKRTMAMALISGSIGIGGFIFTPLLSAAVHNFGWRQAAFGCGVTFLLVGWPLALLVRRSAESMGLLPDGDPVLTANDGSPETHPLRRKSILPCATRLRTSSFWFLTTVATSTSPQGHANESPNDAEAAPGEPYRRGAHPAPGP